MHDKQSAHHRGEGFGGGGGQSGQHSPMMQIADKHTLCNFNLKGYLHSACFWVFNFKLLDFSGNKETRQETAGVTILHLYHDCDSRQLQ